MRVIDSLYFLLWTIANLVIARPKTVYVGTNPPMTVPFVVCIYARLFRAKYYFHVQDIHPEATRVAVPLNRVAFTVLQWLDSITLRHATGIITLSPGMKSYIRERSGTTAPIVLLDNPAVINEDDFKQPRDSDVIFCGNAGRLQHIPLMIDAIKEYLESGGSLRFTFAGGGVYSKDIQTLANSYPSVTYLGRVSPDEAAKLLVRHRWGLMPITDEVTRYAFPSKSSCYLVSGCKILAVCSETTSVAEWVKEKGCGVVADPSVPSVVRKLKQIEEETVALMGRQGSDSTRSDAVLASKDQVNSSLPAREILAFYSIEQHSDILLDLVTKSRELGVPALDQKSV
ncbi:MAG: hypothetical protein JJU25_02960 [Halomonas sp.]|nr:hypothetical protein [Halomonas sp.]MCC5881583.1 hypothetical protein [Halomonas sp.]